METLQIGDELSGEVDDSNTQNEKGEPFSLNGGYENGRCESIQLLDLSDDVMLYILKNLSPRDLKALGFTCLRFASLVLERSLWRKVDARGQACGTARFRWLLSHALHEDTTSLMLTGFSRHNRGCWGHFVPKPGEEEPKDGSIDPTVPRVHEMQFYARNPYRRQNAVFRFQARQLPRIMSSPAWPDEPRYDAVELVAEDFIATEKKQKRERCTGPRFTLTGAMYLGLMGKCPNLTTLVLEYCNINCRTIQLSHLPSSLTTLSLRGAKCFNLQLEESFLFKIQDALPDLETLDLSECEWLDPSSFLPLSKLRKLTRLRLRDCPRLSEFVAYSSLASRYGFKALQELDMRGCPVSDSEVSSFSWLPDLRVLRLTSYTVASVPGHKHFRVGRAPAAFALEEWELEEPEFFKQKLLAEREGEGVDADKDFIDPYIDPYIFTDSEPDEISTDENCTAFLAKKRQQKEKKTTKRRQEDSSGDSAEINQDAPSCSKYRKTEGNNTKGGDKKKDGDRKKDGRGRKDRRGKRNGKGKKGGRNKEESDSDSDDTSSGVITVVRRGNRMETEKTSTKKRQGSQSTDGKVNGKRKSKRIEAKEKERKEQKENETNAKTEPVGSVNEGASTSWERTRHVRGFICLRRTRDTDEDDPPQDQQNQGQRVHRAVYLNFSANGSASTESRESNSVSDRVTFFHTSPVRLPTVSLVTDSSVRQFGRADGEDITYVNFGPNGPIRFQGIAPARPERSNLRSLSMVGYINITDRSLVHLATAAPYLEFLDFRGTRVTAEGVEKFQSLRPDCKVLFGNIEE